MNKLRKTRELLICMYITIGRSTNSPRADELIGLGEVGMPYYAKQWKKGMKRCKNEDKKRL